MDADVGGEEAIAGPFILIHYDSSHDFGIATDFVELVSILQEIPSLHHKSIAIFALWPVAQLLHFHLIQLSYLLAPRPRM